MTDRRPLVKWLGLLLVIWCAGSSAASDADPQRVNLLVALGAHDLALRLLDELQPADRDTPGRWREWEQARLSLYHRQENWDALEARSVQIPADLPVADQHTLRTQAAELLLSSDRGEAVRKILRELMWRGGGGSERHMSRWRRLVVRSYLAEDAIADARLAMERYQDEYLPADTDWAYLYGQVLLRDGDAAAAAASLATVQTEAGRLLRALARLRAEIDDPADTIAQLQAIRERAPDPFEFAASLWSLMAEAAAARIDPLGQVGALEQLFNQPDPIPAQEFRSWRIEDLWQAYRALGESVGNQQNLLLGELEPWQTTVSTLRHNGRHAEVRAVLALLASTVETGDATGTLHEQLYDALRDAELERVAVRLYETESRFQDPAAVPVTVRHRIVRYAIAQRDVQRAARMSAGLAPATVDQDPLGWLLVRARLALLAGAFERGEAVLREAVETAREFDEETADKVMQLIFDLQTVGRARAAFELFKAMHRRVGTLKQKRETLFWMADALRDQDDFPGAVEHYFQSADYGGAGTDIWAQTARYRAAETLAEGGFLQDAQRVYEHLLSVTQDPKRSLALERRLQELWLRQAKQDHVDSGREP